MDISIESVRKLIIDSDGRSPAAQARSAFAAGEGWAEVVVLAPVRFERGLAYRSYTYVPGEGGLPVRARRRKALLRELRRERRGE